MPRQRTHTAPQELRQCEVRTIVNTYAHVDTGRSSVKLQSLIVLNAEYPLISVPHAIKIVESLYFETFFLFSFSELAGMVCCTGQRSHIYRNNLVSVPGSHERSVLNRLKLVSLLAISVPDAVQKDRRHFKVSQ